ncbi:cell division protein ZapA [Halodesulfovibrio marinisediminis]|uniref:Cell division protein ZapA n=1 Tax=Halodesulfovibrio marinisediminis DSM 17456 TaxID=1121457 RepID=A0A1N6FYE4_9BACT|nr:cell division protein ZapA [Halodesulfovibrio marinisediminis]SIO00210.1 cell division protein ZapA [Halodesulfovibrio marinisediminis DSM 17456]
MRSFNLKILGTEVSFKSEADHDTVERAKVLVEDRYNALYSPGMPISKEKLLTFLLLGLADDYLQTADKLHALEERLERLTTKVESCADNNAAPQE